MAIPKIDFSKFVNDTTFSDIKCPNCNQNQEFNVASSNVALTLICTRCNYKIKGTKVYAG